MNSLQFFVNSKTPRTSKYIILLSSLFYVIDITIFLFIGILEESITDLINVGIFIFWFLLTILIYNL